MNGNRVYFLMNMQGSKGECVYNDGSHSFSLTRGRGTANDVHVVCIGRKDAASLRRRPIAYVLDPVKSNSMKSANPHSGIHREEYAVCLDTSTQNPIRNGGGMLVVEAAGCAR